MQKNSAVKIPLNFIKDMWESGLSYFLPARNQLDSKSLEYIKTYQGQTLEGRYTAYADLAGDYNVFCQKLE